MRSQSSDVHGTSAKVPAFAISDSHLRKLFRKRGNSFAKRMWTLHVSVKLVVGVT
jgi:hypothetical protein